MYPLDLDLVTPQTFHFALDRKKLRAARRREGGYLLRSNIKGDDPGRLWRVYLQLVEIEQAFKELKNDLSFRPIHHQRETRIEAHIFVAFLAYCLMVTLRTDAQSRARKARRHPDGSTSSFPRPTAERSSCLDTPSRRPTTNSCCDASSSNSPPSRRPKSPSRPTPRPPELPL